MGCKSNVISLKKKKRLLCCNIQRSSSECKWLVNPCQGIILSLFNTPREEHMRTGWDSEVKSISRWSPKTRTRLWCQPDSRDAEAGKVSERFSNFLLTIVHHTTNLFSHRLPVISSCAWIQCGWKCVSGSQLVLLQKTNCCFPHHTVVTDLIFVRICGDVVPYKLPFTLIIPPKQCVFNVND